jgi:phage repressor protein C with HTH and peptisase S24 domain
MSMDFGPPGYEMPQHERVALLVAKVGGATKAAAIMGRTRQHIDNMRKAGASLRLEDLLPLCEAAHVSIDWVATGYQVRPDLASMSIGAEEPDATGFESLPGFTRLMPVRPETVHHQGGVVERWQPSEIAVSVAWLDARGIAAETTRYAIAGDDGMAPEVPRGAMVLVDTRPAPRRSGLYMVAVGDELLARRLHRLPGGEEELVADAQPAWRFRISAEANDGLVLHRIFWCGHDV